VPNPYEGMKPEEIDLATFKPTKYYKLPADPWHIVCRWTKQGTSYGDKSLLNHILKSTDIIKHMPSDGDDNAHIVSVLDNRKQDFVNMHMEIQIYEMEYGVYLVDFKCSGYERPDGTMLEEKDVMSPFPFLDMAAKLIIQLAEAD
jgi:carbon catabolite-derepressing protein kinase